MTTRKNEHKGRAFSCMRWSSEPQSWGDSERRQSEAAKAWCERRGLSLVESTYADRGVSGWKGKNRQAGALGQLLKTAQSGDTILIEDCDRWSREEPLDALVNLGATVNRGIKVVYLKTGIEVAQDNFKEATACSLNSTGITNIVRIGISGWDSCQNDTLKVSNDPDLNGLQYNERTVFIP
jgi:DNA invertase Pin-like site-specific DNA recombinase